MLSSFRVASTKPGAALARREGWLPWRGRGWWFLAPRDRGPEAGEYYWQGHLALPDADPRAELVGDRDEDDERADHHDPERGEFRQLAVSPLLPDHDRQYLASRRVEQHRAAQLTH